MPVAQRLPVLGLSVLGLLLTELTACDPGSGYKTSYHSQATTDGGSAPGDITPTLNWMHATFDGIYQVASFTISDGSCSSLGADHTADLMADYFWVQAFVGFGATTEICLCGSTQEECRTFIGHERAGELVPCLLQRTVSNKINNQVATSHWDHAGSQDGNSCIQGGTEDVAFERSGNQIQIDHQQTTVDYTPSDGNCTDARGGAAAASLACSQRDILTGTWIASE